MSTTVDQLIVEIRAETAGLRKGLNDVNKKLGTANKTARSSIMNFSNLGKVFAAVGVAKLGSQVISTTRTFEDLNATLRAITGSAEKADASFALIRKFTSTTTFQLENVTEGFITLFNAGIMPTAERLTNFGNVAAAFNKDITQITRAIFNATTGEMEMLKQFGIKAKQNTDSIDVTFAGATTNIEKTSGAIVEFVENIGRTQFSTALEERALTLSGAISNMNDSFSEFFFAVGEGGFKDVMTELALSTKALLDKTRPLATALGGKLKEAFELAKKGVQNLKDNMDKLILVILVLSAVKFGMVLIRIGQAGIAAAKGIGILKTALISLNTRIGRSKVLMLLMVSAFMAMEAGLFDDVLDKINDKLATVPTMMDILGIDLDETNTEESLDEINAKMETLLGKFEDGTASVEEFATILELAKGSIGQLGLIYEGLNSKVANGSMTFDEATATLREFLRTTGPTGEAMARIGEEVEGLSSSFSTDLTNALMEGENALESFKNFAQNIVSAVISAFMELLVIQPIVDAILGMFQISAPKGGVKPSGSSPVTKAGGGTIQGGRATLVGERGPEIFVPNTGGTIMNNMNSKNAMGGGGTTIINQSINFATGVVPTVRAEVMKMMPQIAEVTKGAVAESAMRGGNFRRALQGG